MGTEGPGDSGSMKSFNDWNQKAFRWDPHQRRRMILRNVVLTLYWISATIGTTKGVADWINDGTVYLGWMLWVVLWVVGSSFGGRLLDWLTRTHLVKIQSYEEILRRSRALRDRQIQDLQDMTDREMVGDLVHKEADARFIQSMYIPKECRRLFGPRDP